MVLSNAISDAAVGGTLNTGIALLSGASWDEAFQAGKTGALFGLGSGSTRCTIEWHAHA